MSQLSDSRNTLTMLMPKSSSTTSSMSACLCVRLAVPPSSSRLICETCLSCDDEQMREEERCLCTCSEWTDEWREKSVCSTRVLCVAYSSCRIWSTMELVRYETTDSFTSLKSREMGDIKNVLVHVQTMLGVTTVNTVATGKVDLSFPIKTSWFWSTGASHRSFIWTKNVIHPWYNHAWWINTKKE